MASSYNQISVKRQKIRETKSIDNIDYFQGIDKIEYNNMASTTETMSYRYYNASERVHGRCMEDWLKLSVSFTAFKYNGSDKYGKPNHSRNWDDGSNSTDNFKRQIKAFFEFCQKLGIKYWSAYDTDLVPAAENCDEYKNNTEEMIEFILDYSQKNHMQLLFVAPDLHSHPRYASGAITNNDISISTQAATQIKRTIEMSRKLNAENILIWPLREKFHPLKEDMQKEFKLFGKVLKMAADFKDRIGFRGQLSVLPRFFDSSTDSYVWDGVSCVCLLKHFHLERLYKVIVETGRDLYVTQLYNMVGGIEIKNENDSATIKNYTIMMKYIIEQGTPYTLGINLNLYRKRENTEIRDYLLHYVKYIDLLAKSLRTAATMVSEQTFTKHLQQRYASYQSGFGSRLLNGEATLEECEEYIRKGNQHCEPQSSKSDHLDIVFQRYLDNCDHLQ